MRGRCCLFATSFFLLATGCFAADIFVLGVERQTADSGQAVTTDLTIVNRGVEPAAVTLTYIPSDGDVPAPAMQSASPGQSLVLADVLSTLWNVASGRGVVRISGAQPLTAVASKYRQTDGGGRLGSVLPTVDEPLLLGAGQRGDIVWISESTALADAPATSVWLFSPSVTAAVDITITSPGGATLATASLSGGAKAQEFPLSSLISGELPVGRARISVRNGRAWAWAEVRSRATGDLAVATLAPESSQAPDLSIVDAIKQTGDNGYNRQTNVRLFNPSVKTATITATFGLAKKSYTLAANSIFGIGDILTDIGAGNPSQGTVRLESGTRFVAVAKTIVTSADGSSSFGEIHPASSFVNLISAGQSGIVPQLAWDGARTFLVSEAFEDGAAATAVLRDGDGNILTSQPGYNLDVGGSRRDDVADLFPGITIPPGASVELQVTTGSLLAGAAVSDDRSGDVFYRDAAPTLDGSCAPPQISSLTATQLTLAKPGPVTFSWNVDLADSVDLSPVAANQPVSGSSTVTVNTTSDYQLKAVNSCGSVSAPIRIAVGMPVAKSVATITAGTAAAQGAPGQLILIQFDNLTEPAAVGRILWRAANGDQAYSPVLGFEDQGAIYTRVPLWTAVSPQTGYRSGAFTVSAVFADSTTNGIPFQILPLTYTGDPVAGFTAWLDKVIAAGRQSITDVRAINGLTGLAAAQTTYVNTVEADLRRMATEIGQRGTSTLTFGTSAVSAPVTKDDLAALLAYTANIIAGNAARPPALASGGTRSAGTCLDVIRPLIPTCKGREAVSRTLQPITDFIDTIPQLDPLGSTPTDDLIKRAVDTALKRVGLEVLFSRLKLLTDIIDIQCKIAPIRLNNDSFHIEPKSIPQTSKSLPIKLKARLTPEYRRDILAQALLDKETSEAVDRLGIKNKLNKQVATKVVKFLFDEAYGDLNKTISDLIRSVGNLGTLDDVEIGKCDLFKFYPFLNGPDNKTFNSRTVVVRAPAVGDGENDWFMRGVKQGKDKICVVPIVQNFLFSQKLELSYGSLYKKDCAFTVPAPVSVKSGIRSAGATDTVELSYADDISVGPAQPSVSTHDYQLAAYLDDGTGILNELEQTSRQAVTKQNNFSRGVTDGSAVATIDIKQVDDITWVGTFKASTIGQPGPSGRHKGLMTIQLDIVNPPNQDDTQSIEISLKQTGSNCSYYYYRVITSTETKSETAVDVKTPNPQDVSQNVPGGRSAILFIGLRPGDNPGPGISFGQPDYFCTAELKILMRPFASPPPTGGGPRDQ